MRLYVGNLNFETTAETLRKHFEQFGQVIEVDVVSDRDSGQSRGFGFVTLPNVEHGQAAIEGANGAELDGRVIVVNEAKPKPGGNRRSAGL